MVEGLGPSTVLRKRSAIAAVGFRRSLWENPIWEVVRPHLDPMDSVCLRTASMESNVRGKYGPDGGLFFFLLIQKELATVPGGETFSPFFSADIRTLRFSADVLKKCTLIALHLIPEAGRDGEDGRHAPDLVGEWNMGCLKSPMLEE